MVTESAEVIEQRKRKFAKNEENLVSLDDEIEKSKLKTKKIRKNKDKKFGQRVRGDHKERKGRKFRGEKERRRSGDGIGNKSRKEIFGKKRFIKRSKGSNGRKIVT